MQTVDKLIVPLLNVRLFQDLKPLQLKAIALSAERRVFEQGERVIYNTERGEAAYLLMSGIAEIDGTGEGLPKGTLIGEMAMLIETVHTTTVIARSSLHTLKFERTAIHELMARDPDLAARFLEDIRARLAETSRTLHAAFETMRSPQSAYTYAPPPTGPASGWPL